jgi:probable phosphoglycerate mutase
MPALMLLRHGPTDWNATHRLQGRADVPLNDEGRALVGGWTLPKSAMSAQWITSPLQRCQETAAVLRHRHRFAGIIDIEPRLIEMSFGEWEGRTLDELRSTHGPAMTELEGRGLDFHAPGGESPREVQSRLTPWLQEIADKDDDVLAITHKGVIRALYALASGWDMRMKPKDRLASHALHVFTVERATLHIDRLNLALRTEVPLARVPP